MARAAVRAGKASWVGVLVGFAAATKLCPAYLRLYFVGRRDAMIKSAGNRISPQEIEDAALGTGLVAEAVALGIPDERLGQAVHLVVRAAPGSSDTSEELPRKLMQELPNFMQPKQIHWRQAMPISPNGKIDRTGLYAELTA